MTHHKNLLVLVAYANTLTPFIPSLFNDLDIVSRELVGMVPSVERNVSAERAAVGQTIYIPVSQRQTAFNITPSMQIPQPADFTVDNVPMQITKSRAVAFGLNGEEQRGLNAGGPGAGTIINGQFAQAIRTLVNEVENDLFVEGSLHASRAYGTAGTTPFASNVGDTAQLGKILDDNGAPLTNRALVGDTAMGAALRTLQNLTHVNEAGTTMTLRDGELLNLNRFSIKESAQVTSRAIGTAAATATTNAAGYAQGATSITLAAAGTGSILQGDYITFAGDTNKYLVITGAAAVSGATITIAKPGLRVAVPAATTGITVVSRATRNLGFHSSAIQLIARAPALVDGNDAAIDSYMLVDPRSGIPFEVRVYEGYRMKRYEVGLAWGVKAIKDEHIAALLG